MSSPISGNLSRISKAASEINQLADQASEQIRTLEAHLNEMNLGITVYLDSPVHYGRAENNDNVTMPANYCLGYGRDDDGKFGLIVEAYAQKTDAKDDNKGVTFVDEYGQTHPENESVWVQRLERTSREIRIASVPQIPALIEALLKKAEATVESLRGGVEQTRATVADLKAALNESKK